jgi:hypothetical protein
MPPDRPAKGLRCGSYSRAQQPGLSWLRLVTSLLFWTCSCPYTGRDMPFPPFPAEHGRTQAVTEEPSLCGGRQE